MANPIINKWDELKVLMESLDLDIHKHAGGNASAGVRSRRGLRQLKNDVASIIKLSIETDKERKSNK